MFKEFFRGIATFFTKDKVIILVVFLVLVLGYLYILLISSKLNINLDKLI